MMIHEAYPQLANQLKKLYDEREANHITDMAMEHITGFGKVDRLLNKLTTLSNAQQGQLKKITDELLNHKPIQYVLGEAWFAGMKFYVNEDVLIPRPETEELVESVTGCGLLVSSILDVGTGSGCIPVAIKKKLPDANIVSVDTSEDALNVAKQNADILNTEIDFRPLDFLDENSWNQLGMFDIIVSNPPYIKESESKSMAEHVLAFEPHIALFVPDDDALLFYKKIAAFGMKHLNKSGNIFVEINETLGNETVVVFQSYGYETKVIKDMQGKDRIVRASGNQ